MYKYVLTAAIIFTLGASCISGGGNNDDGNAKKVLPEMTLVGANGETIDLQSLKGKKVFVNLWATWCPPCVSEMPSIQQLYNKTSGGNTAFVLISFDKNFATAKNWIRQKNYSLPIYAPAGDLPDLFQVNGIPTTFIFDEKGELIFSQTGSENYSSSRFVNMLSKGKG